LEEYAAMLQTWLPLLGLLALVPCARGAEDTTELFNGKDLDGWVVEGTKDYKEGEKVHPVWSVQDGLLHCAGRGYGFLRYDKRQFGDFALHVEYRMTRGCNSGIGIRTVPYDPKTDPVSRPSYACYEIQLLDDADKPASKYGSGSLYRYVAPKENAVKAAPEWNTVDVECVGPRIRITINGKEILDVDQTTIDEIKDKPLKGFVCVQNHSGVIDFRNLRIREIKKE
jgi:hypothetical protein